MPRPRYSLLGFLLFTAVVAGGVKLWRGPHHVVDRSNPQMEDEYTYYRDWDGTKVVDGVRIRRYQSFYSEGVGLPGTASTTVEFDFYREGKMFKVPLSLIAVHKHSPDQMDDADWKLMLWVLLESKQTQLQDFELQILFKAIAQERSNLAAKRWSVHELFQ